MRRRAVRTMGTARRRTPWYWLLTKSRIGGLEVFMERTAGGEVVLPVFGSEEDAKAYLLAKSGSWAPRKTGNGELLSILFGVCREARWVALDPPPEVEAEDVLGLLSVPRENFVEPLLGRGRPWFERERERQSARASGLRLQPAGVPDTTASLKIS